jgi:hypothetical protein
VVGISTSGRDGERKHEGHARSSYRRDGRGHGSMKDDVEVENGAVNVEKLLAAAVRL